MLHQLRRIRDVAVLVATPDGGRGQGGIDRVMQGLRQELQRQAPVGLRLSLAPTRGSGHIALSALHLGVFGARMLLGILRGRLDVVHINLASNGSTYRKMVIAGFARLIGVPYVLHLHGGDYRKFWSEQSPAMEKRIRDMFEGAARVIVLGRVWRDFIAARAPAAADRIVILPNASAPPILPRQGGGEKVHILFLGRINDNKGVPQLGEALRRLADDPRWRATLAGDGYVAEARATAARFGIAERVNIPGWVDGAEVARLISEADILVLPSLIENLPLSIIEAMGAGLAVVATPVGAVEDIVIDGVTGLLVPPGDADALTAALARLIADGELRRRLGDEARTFHARHLALAPYAEKMLAIWRDAAR